MALLVDVLGGLMNHLHHLLSVCIVFEFLPLEVIQFQFAPEMVCMLDLYLLRLRSQNVLSVLMLIVGVEAPTSTTVGTAPRIRQVRAKAVSWEAATEAVRAISC